jgi:hypothetical protein
VVLGVALLAGCSGGSTALPVVTRAPAAATGTEDVARTRATVVALVGQVTAAARALDEADARCAAGDREGARRTRRTQVVALAHGPAAVSALPAAVRAYGLALARVRSAVPQVQAAVRAGEAEVAALQRFSATATMAWARYATLDHQESTWVKRAFVPWYRTAQESADAYAVLTDGVRTRLVVARRALGVASDALRPLSEAAVAAFAAADQALAGA